jgi:hypothetical protein
MSAINEIQCPACGHAFHAEQALALQIEKNIKDKFQREIADERKKNLEAEQKLRAYQESLVKEKETILKEREALQVDIRKGVEAEKAKLEKELTSKIQSENQQMMQHIQEELANKQKENLLLKEKEIELMRTQQRMQSMEQELTLKFEKQAFEQQKSIEEKIHKQAEEQNQMKLKEKDTQLEQMKKQVAEMQRKLEQGSMQLQGEAQELVIEELLKNAFPFDLIDEVGKGMRGADVIQTVNNKLGKSCGMIIYESKRTKAFSDTWIEKLKTDLRSQKADVAVLVTDTMPKDMETFGLREGVWVCTFHDFIGLATVLREALLRVAEAKGAEENRGEKMQMLYSYLTGNEFRQQVEAIVEAFSSMKDSLEKEKRAMQKLWAEREKQIDKVVTSTIGMYGSIRGIAGSAVGTIKALELGDDELLLEE